MKYSVMDIERMRYTLTEVKKRHRGSYNPDTLREEVEREVRTYMSNETTPDELEDYFKIAWVAHARLSRGLRNHYRAPA